MAPRFKKNLIVAQEENLGDVQLRPNSMLFNKASVKSNNIMNSRPLETTLQPSTPKQTNSLLTKEPLPIKQVTTDKTKQSKKDKVIKTNYLMPNHDTNFFFIVRVLIKMKF